MSNIKPVTVDTVYYAIKLFIKTNSILKQVLEDELCDEFETIIDVTNTTADYLWIHVNKYGSSTYTTITPSKEQLVKIINDFIA